jgi:hypothetical protein
MALAILLHLSLYEAYLWEFSGVEAFSQKRLLHLLPSPFISKLVL